MTTKIPTFINEFHIGALLNLILSVIAAIYISSATSPQLRASGWHIFHALAGLMGFGTFMVLGTQKKMVPLLRDQPAKPLKNGILKQSLIVFMLPLAWVTWWMYLMEGITGIDFFYILGIVYGSGIFICLCLFAWQHYHALNIQELLSNLSLRYYASSMFMCFLAYGQLVYITINYIKPILPFSETLYLRHNYLALSLPISLTVIGTMRLPFQEAEQKGRIKGRWLWEAQYGLLMFGAFALFFALLFDINPDYHHIFVKLQAVFSDVLGACIIVLIIALFWNLKKIDLPIAVLRYYISALFYLTFAGIVGVILGYSGSKTQYFYIYFYRQSHIHLALLGWIGMGLSGVVFYLLWKQGYDFGKLADSHFMAMHLGIVLISLSAYFPLNIIRFCGGTAIIFACLSLLLIIYEKEEYIRNQLVTYFRPFSRTESGKSSQQ